MAEKTLIGSAVQVLGPMLRRGRSPGHADGIDPLPFPRGTTMRVILTLAITLLAAIAAENTAAAQIEPNAGSWKTWVISSGRDFRAPPPPNDTAASGEIAKLKALASQRDPKAKDLIAYWDVGPPSYRWQQIALAETLRNNLPWQWAVRDFALLHVAIYDAMLAAWDTKYAFN